MQEAKINSPNVDVIRLARGAALAIAITLAAVGLAIIAATYGEEDYHLWTVGLTILLLSGTAGAAAIALWIHLSLVTQVQGALSDVLTKLGEHDRSLKQIIQAEGTLLDAVGDELAPRRRLG